MIKMSSVFIKEKLVKYKYFLLFHGKEPNTIPKFIQILDVLKGADYADSDSTKESKGSHEQGILVFNVKYK
jgi:hypothetical protein